VMDQEFLQKKYLTIFLANKCILVMNILYCKDLLIFEKNKFLTIIWHMDFA
jgi:hypothetical protein